MADASFPKRRRLRRTAEFRRVFDRRASAGDGRLVVYVCENPAGTTRLGLSVARKVGGAVVRNLWKRRLREAFRVQQAVLPPGLDVVVVPRQAEVPDLADLARTVLRLVRKGAARLASSAGRR